MAITKLKVRYGCRLLCGAPPTTEELVGPIGAVLLCVDAYTPPTVG